MNKCKCNFANVVELAKVDKPYIYYNLGIVITRSHIQYGCGKCRQVWGIWDDDSYSYIWTKFKGIRLIYED